LAVRPAHKPLRAAGTLLLAVAAAGVAACGSGDERIDDASLPYSFAYPPDFESGGEADVPPRESGFDNQTIVAKANGQDLVAVQTQPLRQAVTRQLVPRVNREVEQNARRTGKVVSRRKVRVGGLDGVALDMRLRGEAGVPVSARWIYVAKDRTLYWINCQWRSDRAAVLRACDKVMRSFKPR
jgi:hypothetical protein